jgi:cytochrome b subunit of formate dehydrogenase
MMRSPIVVAILGFALWGSVSLAIGQDTQEACTSCHEQGKKLQASAHADLGCSSCHEKHESYPHPAGVPKPECSTCHAEQAGQHAASVHGQALKAGNAAAPTCGVCHGGAHEIKNTKASEFHKGVPDTCGMCHTEIAQQFHASVHGQAVAKGITAAPVCTNCHGEHSILSPKSPASTVNAAHVRDTCEQCHGNVQLARRFGLPEDRIISFDASFHGLASRSGSQSVANCASCHGFHSILPSSDPKSSTNVKNLPATCGRCHPGAGSRFALGSIHQVAGKGETDSVRWARIAYSILIPLTIGFMLLHNLGDWLRKLSARRFRKGRAPASAPHAAAHQPEIRMYPFERIEHALLVTSFATLVWTGFALKYPGQWWALPLVSWERFFPVRGVVHRVAAGVFLIDGLLHVLSILRSRRLRQHWMELWPRRSDVPEAILNFGYNLGLTNRKPVISAHSYIEKAEYWAVVWGGVIMGLTGVMLWANNLTLKWLPKSALDLATSIHLYEAILATLAIVVWHFYGVIFDPDVYPLETAFLTGVSVKEHAAEAQPGHPAADIAAPSREHQDK